MTQEQKDLLLKDLCARLPYGVKVKLGDNPNIFELGHRIRFAVMYGDSDKLEDILDITNIKPYLFPMSSMTKEQNLEFLSTCRGGNAYHPTYKSFDWLDKNLFDYRGLIPMGLADDATELSVYTNSDE